MQRRLPLPDRIQNAPDLELGLELYLGAFYDLDSCRTIGWGEGPIPWTAVEQYAQLNEIEGEQRADLHYHVRQLDTAYLQFRASKAGKNAPPPPATPGGK